MIKTGLAKLSPAQMKKLHQGKSVRVQYGSAHEIPLPAKDHKKLMKAHSKGKGMILSVPHLGGSLFSDLKRGYEQAIPAKYRAPLESMAVMGLQDAGVLDGGSLFSDLKRGYEQSIPAKYRAPLETMALMGAEDAGIIGSGRRTTRGNQLTLYNPNQLQNRIMPSNARSGSATQGKGPGRKLVRKSLHGKGWKEDLSSLATKAYGQVQKLDPEGKLRKAGVKALAKYLVPDEEGKSNETARLAAELVGDYVTQGSAPPSESSTRRAEPRRAEPRPKKKVITATVVDEAPAPFAPIPVSYKYLDEDAGRSYQPVRWMGTGTKEQGSTASKGFAQSSKVISNAKKAAPKKSPHMVKGSEAARAHMAKLRAMRMVKKGGALYPAGY
jgi:hypothetical protein